MLYINNMPHNNSTPLQIGSLVIKGVLPTTFLVVDIDGSHYRVLNSNGYYYNYDKKGTHQCINEKTKIVQLSIKGIQKYKVLVGK